MATSPKTDRADAAIPARPPGPTDAVRGGQVNPEERHGKEQDKDSLEGGTGIPEPRRSPQADGDPRELESGRVDSEQTPLGPTQR